MVADALIEVHDKQELDPRLPWLENAA